MYYRSWSGVDRTPNPQSELAVIVQHEIIKPRLGDELTALDDLYVVDQRHIAYLVMTLGTAKDQLPTPS